MRMIEMSCGCQADLKYDPGRKCYVCSKCEQPEEQMAATDVRNAVKEGNSILQVADRSDSDTVVFRRKPLRILVRFAELQGFHAAQ